MFKETSPARIIVFVVFAAYALAMLYALAWAVMGSLREHVSFIQNPNKLPTEWLFSNYREAFTLLSASGNSLVRMIYNSLWFTISKALLSIAVAGMCAYVVARYEFVGKKAVLFILLVVMMIPIYGSEAALFKLTRQLRIYDSPMLLILSMSGTGVNFFILRSFFMTLSKEYSESASIDGAGHMQIFLQIMLPMALPAIATLLLLGFIGVWNDYMTPIKYLPSYPTMASGLFIYETVAKHNMDKPVYFAGVMMCAVPPLLLFVMFREKFMTNMSIGGLKG
ncbi:MAG: carbohydrate ABC transporter permease [Firmicutes bacterium]|nr:carbohydrate ABC transporter permease [Bacillota bacterium]